ncbi:MAG: type II secretion system protein GspE [Verrucomicrobia bacterium]|nr:type II secretion system protein GspE [Verrucomicrobiota bacterium]
MEPAPLAPSPSAAWLDRLLGGAVTEGVVDLHLEPDRAGLWVRRRGAGGWEEERVPATIAGPELVARIKVLAHLDPNERRLPLDGRLRWSGGTQTADFRVATLPALHGEVVALRVLQRSAVPPALSSLGLSSAAEERLRSWLAQGRGLVAIAGPTGAGKTTTAYAALGCVDATQRKIMTVEDPVEFQRDGFVQIAVDAEQGLTFADALRSLLRQDPDLIFVGEVRDAATAAVAVQAALTGHGVVATVHAASTEGAIIRLLDLGVEPFLLADALAGVVAQRLVARLCPVCRVPAPWPRDLGPSPDGVVSGAERSGAMTRGPGCAACAGRGVVGRVGFFEVIAVTRAIREAMVRVDGLEALRGAMAAEVAVERGGGLRAQLLEAACRGGIDVNDACTGMGDADDGG